MRAILLLILSSSVLLYASCERQKSTAQEIAEENETDILTYIEEENIDATRHESGIYYFIREEGSGTQPNSFSQVQISFTSFLLDGTVVEQADTNNLKEINLAQPRISGLRIGLPLIKEEGEILLLLPARMWNRNAREVLAYDLKLHRVN